MKSFDEIGKDKYLKGSTKTIISYRNNDYIIHKLND